MFVEFKSADETGDKVTVNANAVSHFASMDDKNTRISFIGGGADVWVAEKYAEVKAKIAGRVS